MIEEIKRQPEVWLSLLDRREELADIIDRVNLHNQITEIFAYGCGDGFFAAQAATCSYRNWISPSYYGVSSLEFLLCHAKTVNSRTLMLPISMSGNVDRTVEALVSGIEQESEAIAITNTDTGRLSRIANYTFNLNISEPTSFLAGTVTYTASLLTLLMVATLIAENSGRTQITQELNNLSATIDLISKRISDIEAKAKNLVAKYHNAPHVYFLGAGANVATAKYAASKFVEVCRTLAIPQDLEEFGHSNFWQFSSDALVVVISETGEQQHHVDRVVATLRDFGAPVVEISEEPSGGSDGGIAIPTVTNTWTPITYSLPIQFIAYYWSLLDGVNPNKRTHLRDDKIRFMTNRKLTRYSQL
jgi:glucosamine 6-phosphate synthetase-like amidotransferase/phosphosugar isomerase protein